MWQLQLLTADAIDATLFLSLFFIFYFPPCLFVPKRRQRNEREREGEEEGMQCNNTKWKRAEKRKHISGPDASARTDMGTHTHSYSRDGKRIATPRSNFSIISFLFPLFFCVCLFFSFYPPSMNFLLQQVETVPDPGHCTRCPGVRLASSEEQQQQQPILLRILLRCFDRLSHTDVRGVLICIPRGEREIVVYGSYFESPWMPLGESSPLILFFTWHGSRWKLTLVVFFSSLFTLIIYAAPAAGPPGVTCCCSLTTHNTYCYTADKMCNSHGSRENGKKLKVVENGISR